MQMAAIMSGRQSAALSGDWRSTKRAHLTAILPTGGRWSWSSISISRDSKMLRPPNGRSRGGDGRKKRRWSAAITRLCPHWLGAEAATEAGI